MDVRDSPRFPITFSSPGLRFQVQVQSKVIDRSGVRFVFVVIQVSIEFAAEFLTHFWNFENELSKVHLTTPSLSFR